MKLWFTSDTHFGHAKIIEYCQRPFKDVEEMNETMIARWNERVKPDDLVFHLGDFAFGPAAHVTHYRRRLNGDIFLLRGNHDRSKERMRTLGFSVCEDWTIYTRGPVLPRIFMCHKPEARIPEMVGDPEDLIRLCGHVHERWKVKDGIVNVGVDQWDFRPITLFEALNAVLGETPQENT